MQNDPINTAPIKQFISMVKSADASRAKEVRIDIQQAKNLSFTLGIVLSQLTEDLEKLLVKKTSGADEVIQVNIDGKGW